MKRSGTNIWLLALMIISELMLTGLLVQWLRSQWQNEKESLQKDINMKFEQSVDQVMDSMVIKHLIVPALGDSSTGRDPLLKFNRKISSGILPDKQIAEFINDSNGSKHTMVTVTMPYSTGPGQKEKITLSTSDSDEKKLLLRSVKLIIRSTEDSTDDPNGNRFIPIAPDTLLLKKVFADRLEKEWPRFNIMWIADSSQKHSGQGSPVMYFKTNVFRKPIHVEIAHYQKEILSNISSQILFAITLLLVTGAAFFFTWRNLKKQEMLNTLRNDFISNISHELKTPVSTISVALEAIKGFDTAKDRDKKNEYFDIARKEMKRLDHLITQVLDTSMLEEKGEYLKFEDVDIAELTRDVLSSMKARFEQRNAAVTFNAPSEKVILKLDRLHIHGVLINLLDNSLKYCENRPDITISIEKNSSNVTLRIGDNGPGIPKEYLSKVFDKFFRVPEGYTHNTKGYGLGLSFAQRVMSHHSGSMSVRNKDDGGCEFKLLFKVPSS